ncbi:MAG: transglutaminase family protein [Planctomycetota bacterium]
MRYRIKHETEYSYASPVGVGHNQVFLRPRDLPGQQKCLGTVIDFEPVPANSNGRDDYFGNHTTLFTIQESHTHMSVVAVSEVEVTPAGPPIPGMSPPWEQVRDQVRWDTSAAGLETLQFIYDSTLIRALPELTAYAQESFTEGRPVFDASLELTHRIFTDFKYDPTTTTVSTPVDEVFAQRSGVCQDFSHMQIAMLRGLGLPARYVSGYLRTFHKEEDPKLIGADASHAWLAVGDGQGNWTDYDPTNDQIPSEHHITLAWGRDYADVSPVRGVIIGGGDQAIDVKVRVTPI